MLKNRRNGKIIASKVEICDNVFLLAKGLMFSFRKENRACVLVFTSPRKVSLHMWFVFYPIDVLFLDKNKKVVEIKKDFKPFGFYIALYKAMYAVEVVSGIIDKKKIKVGDKLEF